MASEPPEPTIEEGLRVMDFEDCEPTAEEPVDGYLQCLTPHDPYYFIVRPNPPQRMYVRFFDSHPQFAPTSPTRNSAFKKLAQRVSVAPPFEVIMKWVANAFRPPSYISIWQEYHRGILDGASEEQQNAAIQKIKVDFPLHSKRLLHVIRDALCIAEESAFILLPRWGIMDQSEMLDYLKDLPAAQFILLERKWS